MPKFEELEKIINFRFVNKNLLKEALTHRSYLNEHPHWRIPHNERLEYLGDAVLELVVSEYLFNKFTNYPEGKLTSIRSALVNFRNLASVAKSIGLDKFILVSKGEKKDSPKAKDIIIANALEALIGAIYLEGGYNAAKRFIGDKILIYTDDIIKKGLDKDPKSLFQEIVQEKSKITPTYKVLEEKGPNHDRTFVVGVFLGEQMIASGMGSSKQEAEIEAAKKALQIFQKDDQY